MQLLFRLKHEKKSPIDHSEMQYVVHFDNLENIQEDMGYLTFGHKDDGVRVL